MAWYNFFKKEKEPTGKKVYGYDFDGVISIGITPRSKHDVIITGRCIDEQEFVLEVLSQRGIKNKVYFNPMTLEERGDHTLKARRFSGKHKAKTIWELRRQGVNITRFFEDDPVQYKIIAEKHKSIELVHVNSKLVKK